jgi:hypothetical protein
MASFAPGGNPRNLRKFQCLLLEVPAVSSEVLSASKLVDSAVGKSSPTVRPATGCLTGMPGPRSITSIAIAPPSEFTDMVIGVPAGL